MFWSNFKKVLRTWLLRLLFTPVRAVTLQRAQLRVGATLKSVNLSVSDWGRTYIWLYYGSDGEHFWYEPNESDLANSEFLALQSYVGKKA